jgi:hypothetical protein
MLKNQEQRFDLSWMVYTSGATTAATEDEGRRGHQRSRKSGEPRLFESAVWGGPPNTGATSSRGSSQSVKDDGPPWLTSPSPARPSGRCHLAGMQHHATRSGQLDDAASMDARGHRRASRPRRLVCAATSLPSASLGRRSRSGAGIRSGGNRSE